MRESFDGVVQPLLLGAQLTVAPAGRDQRGVTAPLGDPARRITSYNVCYTKLLRFSDRYASAFYTVDRERFNLVVAFSIGQSYNFV